MFLAGLLASEHRRRVTLFAPELGRKRLPRTVSFSLGPVTRPETLRLVADNRAHVLARLGEFGPGLMETDALRIAAEAPGTALGLSHMRHGAAGFGLPARPEPSHQAVAGEICVFDDCWQINSSIMDVRAREWLEKQGVTVVSEESRFALKGDGIVRRDGEAVGPALLVDDALIAAHAGARSLSRIATPRSMVTFLCRADRGIARAAFIHLDHGVTVTRAGTGLVQVHAPDDDGRATERVTTALGDAEGLRLVGRRKYTDLVTHDGAPAIGGLPSSRLSAITGLGPLDVALAPTIARHLAGSASAREDEWARARQARRPKGAPAIDDLRPGPAREEAR